MSLADRLQKAQQKDRIAEVRIRVQERLVESLGPRLYDATLSDTELEGMVHQRLRELLDEEEGPLAAQEKLLIVRQIGDSVLGLGPLEPYIRDPEVTEVMVNNWDTIYVERSGKLYWTGTKFHDEGQLRRTIDKIVAKVGRRVDEASPMVDARLPDGSRVNAIIPPLAIDGPTLTIRKFAADPYQADDLVEFGTMSSSTSKFLEACVRGRINIMVAGGTGAGKTTTLNVISSFIPDDERIVTIEDAAELKLQQPHVVRLESRPPNIEGKGQVSIRDLVRNSLRMRPDRIVVGEVRGAEALDMLQAMNTGHDGSISTIHCNSPRDALSRLETITMMAGMDLGIPRDPRADRVRDPADRLPTTAEGRNTSIHACDGGRRDGGRGHHPAGHLPVRLLGRDGRGGSLPRPAEVHGAATEVPRQARGAWREHRARALRDGSEGSVDAGCGHLLLESGHARGGRRPRGAGGIRDGVAPARDRRAREGGPRHGCPHGSDRTPGTSVSGIACRRPGSGWIPENVSAFGQRFATAQGFGEKLDAQLEAAGVSLRSGEFVVATLGAGLLGAVLGAAILQKPLLAGVIGLVGLLLPTIVLRMSLNRRSDKMREQLPDVLTIIASSLRAGHSFLQALDTVAREIPAPANVEFQRLVAEIRLGRPADDALEALADRVGSPDFRWAVLAVNIQREVGGNLAEILDNVSDTLRERAMMRRQILVLTAEGRLSAWVLSLLPFAIAIYMFAVNPEYISLLFTTQIGLFMLGVAGVLMVLGILWMRKIVDIDV